MHLGYGYRDPMRGWILALSSDCAITKIQVSGRKSKLELPANRALNCE